MYQQVLADAIAWLSRECVENAKAIKKDGERERRDADHAEMMRSLLFPESSLGNFSEAKSAMLLCRWLTDENIHCRVAPSTAGTDAEFEVLVPSDEIEAAEQEISFTEVGSYLDLCFSCAMSELLIASGIPCLVSRRSLNQGCFGLFVAKRSEALARQVLDGQRMQDGALDNLALNTRTEG